MKIKTAVIGAGHLGRHHVRNFAEIENSELIGICDTDEQKLGPLGEKYGAPAYTDYRDLLDKAEAVSIAAPTVLHHEIAGAFLERGVHVLLEKPITDDVVTGEELVDMAERKGCVFQIGHLEQFNPAVMAVLGMIERPLFIEADRLGPFSMRSVDVDVILDLMIHDLDLILSWSDSEVKEIKAVGVPVLSGNNDIANARILFESGCTANVTASRASMEPTRKIRIFQKNKYFSIDCMKKTVTAFERIVDSSIPESGNPMQNIKKIPVTVDESEPLKNEICAFLNSIETGKEPIVPGSRGLKALRLAMEIKKQLPPVPDGV